MSAEVLNPCFQFWFWPNNAVQYGTEILFTNC